jgi:CubicO group peptidase (beta-lactamase class C family)
MQTITNCFKTEMRYQLLVLVFSFATTGYTACYIPSLSFPRPGLHANSPSLHPLIFKLNNLVSDVLSHADDPSSDYQVNKTSFALHLTSSVETIWTSHFTAPILGEYIDSPPTEVTGDTIFRAGSLSKVVTAYASLLQQNGKWDDPITDWVPELRDDGEGTVLWSEITLGSLASHLSGLIMDCKFFF